MSADLGAAASGDKRALRARRKAAELRAAAEKQDRFAEALEKGNAGERHVAGMLDVVDGAGWVVLNDRYKSALSPVNIDHIAVGPPGVFVVDSKNWAGRVRLDERGMASNGYRRDAELLSATTMAEAVHDVAASAASHAVTRPVLAFVQDVGIAEPSPHRGVVCLQASHLLPWLTRQPAVLTPQEVQRVGATLNAAFPPRAGSAKPLTVATLEQYRGGVAPAQRQRAASATRPAPAAPRRKRGAGAPRPLPQRLARVLLELSLRLVLLAIFVVVVLPLILASFMDGLKENLTELPAPRAPATAPPAAPVP